MKTIKTKIFQRFKTIRTMTRAGDLQQNSLSETTQFRFIHELKAA